MSVIASHSPPFAPGRMLGMRLFSRMSQRTFTMMRTWRANMRQRSELLMLDAVELRDIRLTEADVNREASKHFWKSIRFNDR
jgi:uncharacterized protein YjiS (DUF1127 family)